MSDVTGSPVIHDMAVYVTSVRINGIGFLHCHQQRARLIVTLMLRPTRVTEQLKVVIFNQRSTPLTLSQDTSCSLKWKLKLQEPNFPIPFTILGSMADNIIIPFPGNWKRCRELSGNPSYTWQWNRRKNSSPWNLKPMSF